MLFVKNQNPEKRILKGGQPPVALCSVCIVWLCVMLCCVPPESNRYSRQLEIRSVDSLELVIMINDTVFSLAVCKTHLSSPIDLTHSDTLISEQTPSAQIRPIIPTVDLWLQNTSSEDLLVTIDQCVFEGRCGSSGRLGSHPVKDVRLNAIAGATLRHSRKGTIAGVIGYRPECSDPYILLPASSKTCLFQGLDILEYCEITEIGTGIYEVHGEYSNPMVQDTLPPVWFGKIVSRSVRFRIAEE